jgi:hypothetical protein
MCDAMKNLVRSLVLAFGLASAACASEGAPAEETPAESVPSALVITSPARAAFLHSNETVVVRGTGATKALRVNGSAALVNADGTFEAKMEPLRGLNVIVAIDGERTVEQPFLWGDYAPADKPVASAVAFDLGPQGFYSAPPGASLSSLATAALTDKNLAQALVGTKQSGNAAGVSYSYEVTGATYGAAAVKLVPAAGGPDVNVTVTNLVVDGLLTIGSASPKPVQITASEAIVTGIVKLALDENGKLAATMPDAAATLNGFQFDSGNFLLDLAISAVLKGEVEKQMVKSIKEEVPKALSGALDGIALPNELDLSAIGVTTPVKITSKYDAVLFDQAGGTLSMQALFGDKPAPGSPGALAPGSLVLGGTFALGKARPASIGLSLALDGLNQLLFSAWGTGSISFKAADMNLQPKMPPVVMLDDQGSLVFALGEVIVQREGATEPMAAVTIRQKLEGATEPESLVLAPVGEPQLSITWISIGPGPGRDLILGAAKGQLQKALKPVKIPIPKIALDGMSPSLAGQSLVVANTKVSVSESAARLSAAGVMTIMK